MLVNFSLFPDSIVWENFSNAKITMFFLGLIATYLAPVRNLDS